MLCSSHKTVTFCDHTTVAAVPGPRPPPLVDEGFPDPPELLDEVVVEPNVETVTSVVDVAEIMELEVVKDTRVGELDDVVKVASAVELTSVELVASVVEEELRDVEELDGNRRFW